MSDFDIYSVGKSYRNLSIIVIYDIFGFNITQTRVFCDRVASQYSVNVVMPDFFRGTAAPAVNRSEWIAGVSNWTKVSSDLRTTADWLQKTYSTNKFGVVGFCWGGLQVVRACSNLSTLFFTGISIHGGASVTPTAVSQLKQPMLFIAAGNDPALQPNISDAIEQANPIISKQCEYKTYINMTHGFVSAGANYSNPDNVAAIDDVHLTVRSYLDKILGINSTSITINSSSSLSINLNILLILVFFSVYLYL